MTPAIVPASGRSTRMGRPKLVLTIEGQPLIARVIHALSAGGAGPIVVVAPAPEIEAAREVAQAAEGAGAQVIVPPSPTADMRASVELGLDWLERQAAPEAFLLAPADSVGISAELVRQVIDAGHAHRGLIVVPSHSGKRGHPVLFPWTMAEAIRALPPDVGINALLSDEATMVAFETADPGTLRDLDTPADYHRWRP
jgi:molybdenum cofactor cytidylyltransferase